MRSRKWTHFCPSETYGQKWILLPELSFWLTSHAIHAVGAGGAVRLGAVQPAGFIVGDLKLVDVWSKLAVSRDEV